MAATALAPLKYRRFMKGGDAYEVAKKECLSCGNNLSTQHKQTTNHTYVLILARRVDVVNRKVTYGEFEYERLLSL